MMAEPMVSARLILPDPASAPAAISNGTGRYRQARLRDQHPRKQQNITVLR